MKLEAHEVTKPSADIAADARFHVDAKEIVWHKPSAILKQGSE